MMTASPPLILKPVEITTGRQSLSGNNLKSRSNLTRICRFEPHNAKFAVTRSSRSETQSPSQSMEPSELDANVSKTSPSKPEAMEEGIEKVIYRFRFLAILGVFGSLIGSFLCFIKGCTHVVSSFTEYFANGGKVVLLLVEAIDVYLLGTVMLVFGMGLYELFVSNLSIAKSISMENVHQSNLFGLFTLKERPRWLEIKTVSELKNKVGHVIVMLLLIGLFDKTTFSAGGSITFTNVSSTSYT
ncbi:hypothetical protein SLA2020_524440 [Shorea laevis]